MPSSFFDEDSRERQRESWKERSNKRIADREWREAHQ